MSFLTKTGILGRNARNLLYIRPFNKKKAIRLADDKIKTKQFLATRGIPVPKLYGIIRTREELDKYDFSSLPQSFVVKPNFGSGGDGIIPIVNRRENNWITVNGEKLSRDDLHDHIIDIIDGRFSIANMADFAFFEQLIICHEAIAPYAVEGLPDIRIIVHNLIPVMAMLRLPTAESRGKANLHQGAIGVGLDIAKGETTHVTRKNKLIDEIPGIGPLKKLKIPFWDQMLLAASQVQLMTNLGYLAVDIAIDQTSGPVLLEMNARAGLAVQIANLAPLRRRLERIQGVKVTTPEKGVRIAKDMFGNQVEKSIAQTSGLIIVGNEEKIELIMKDGTRKVRALIDNQVPRTIIDKSLIEELGLDRDEDSNFDPAKNILKIKMSMGGKRIQTVAAVEDLRSDRYRIIVGRRDLTGFLIDPSKSHPVAVLPTEKGKAAPPVDSESAGAFKKPGINFFEVDQKIVEIDSQLKLLHHINPINIEEEKEKFMKDFKANPHFEYREPQFDPYEIREKLAQIPVDESALGKLFARKKEELYVKLDLIVGIGSEEFTKASERLYGLPDKALLSEAITQLAGRPQPTASEHEEGAYTAEEAAVYFEGVFKKLSLDNWKVKIKEGTASDCVAGKKSALFVRKGATFTEERLKALSAHEIETHIMSAENGKRQPYEIFNRGTGFYLETQEGLAVYNQNLVMHDEAEKRYWSAASIVAVDTGRSGSFTDVFEAMLKFGFSLEHAWRAALKVKRGTEDTGFGGAFTKEIVYFKGHKRILDFIKSGGDLKKLYIGKIGLDDLALISEIGSLSPPKFLPAYLI